MGRYRFDTSFTEVPLDIQALELSEVPEKWSAQYLVLLRNDKYGAIAVENDRADETIEPLTTDPQEE